MFEIQIARGIEILNDHGPLEWWNEIEVERLQLASCEKCVLGQLYGDFHDGLDELGLSEIESENLGFNAPEWKYLPTLTQEWRDEISKIQMEVVQ